MMLSTLKCLGIEDLILGAVRKYYSLSGGGSPGISENMVLKGTVVPSPLSLSCFLSHEMGNLALPQASNHDMSPSPDAQSHGGH